MSLSLATRPSLWSTVELQKHTDYRGNLCVVEGGHHVPFEIARCYHLFDVPSGSSRAGHAHKRLWQLFVAISGSFSLHLDDGFSVEVINLNRPHLGILVQPGVWRVLDDFSGGAVCLVYASEIYDESDYIRTYDDFLAYKAKGKNRK